jgi:hypothetical protein
MVMNEREKFEIPVYERFADEIDEFINTHTVDDPDDFIIKFNEYYMKVTPEKFKDDPEKGHLFNWFSISEEKYKKIKGALSSSKNGKQCADDESKEERIIKIVKKTLKSELNQTKCIDAGKDDLRCLLVKCNNPKCNKFIRLNYYDITHHNRLYCNDKCRVTSFRIIPKPVKFKMICNSCDNIFRTIDNRRYCSHYCEFNKRKLTKSTYKSYIKQVTNLYETYKAYLPEDMDMDIEEFLDTIFIEKELYKEALQ